MVSQRMASSEPSRVFISYARKDGAVLAQRLQSDLTKEGFEIWLDTQRISGGATWTIEIETALDRANYVVVLMSHGSYVSEICRSEQLRAMRKGTSVIPLKAQSDTDIPLHLEAKNYRDFSDPGQYDARFAELLADIRGNVSAMLPERYRATPIRYLTAPPRVANYLERPEVLRALRDALFAEERHQPIALTALAGMGGIGKTVLAKALTDDEVVQRAFPDGIVWITAGKERKRDFIEEMREVAKALGDDLSGYDNALACENQYRTTIANKAALIVVDDVWSKTDIEPLLAESPRSRFLFTTRDAAIGRFVGAREHRADLLDLAQSRKLLASWANLPVAELPAASDNVITECGRLPMALSVVGAMLRTANEEFWTDTLDLLHKADLSAIQEQLPEGQQSFFKVVEVSFQSLESEIQERYKALAVLLEDMVAPIPVLQTLWNVSEAEARRISRQLVDRSLAQPDGARESIRLHDLQLDYVRAQYPDKEVLELIHGAIRLSSNVIVRDPGQFASQMVGRLLAYQDMPAIDAFIQRVAEGGPTPWLRCLQATLHPPGTPLVRTLQGHSKVVRSTALNGDGRLAVSASDDQTLKVWDVESGRELRTFASQTKYVTAVVLSANGRLAISASSLDETLKVWDVKSGRKLSTLTGHRAGVNAVAVTPDGRLAVSGSSDQTLKVWDVKSGRKLSTLTGHRAAVNAVAVTPDGRLAVSASDDQTLKVWDVESGRELRTLAGHNGSVDVMAMSEDGRLAVSASNDQTLKVWDLSSGRELRTLAGHAGGPHFNSHVSGMAISGDGRLAVSASNDQTLKVWDLSSGRELRTLTGHTNRVAAVAVTADGRLAVSASDDRTLKVWDLRSGRKLSTPKAHCDGVGKVVVIANGRLAASAGFIDRTVKVWDLPSGRELPTAQSLIKRILNWSGLRNLRRKTAGHVATSRNGRRTMYAAYPGLPGPLRLRDLDSGRNLLTLEDHAGWCVALTPDGRLAVSGSLDNTLKLWNLDEKCVLRTLRGHTDSVYDVALSGDGRVAVSASSDNTVKLWDLETGEVMATFTCDGDVKCCAFSEAAKLIVAGDDGGHVYFLRLEEPKSNN